MSEKKNKILVADDEKEIRDILKLLLSSEGYEVTLACDGQEVLDLADDSFDMFILDVNMPKISGFSAGAKLREKYFVPMIFLTAYAGESDKAMGFAAGADDYLTKPFSVEELLAQMQRYAVEGPQLFPDGMTTDQPDQQVCAEIIREKMLLCLDKEIPHGTAVEVTRFTEREDSGIIDLDVTIYCEKASHKGIIIGKHGDMLKRISTLARQDIEKFMGTKVYLETWVKVKENWRDNVNFIRSQGYNEQ